MITYFLKNELTFDPQAEKFLSNVEKIDVARYLKGMYSTKDLMINNFLSDERDKYMKNEILRKGFIDEFLEMYDDIEPFSYEEAFKIENEQFRAIVFGSIDVSDMVRNLGHERIDTAGKPVKRKQFDVDGNFTGYKEYDNIYETHRINGEKLGLSDTLYAVRCWCTSTNEEHWIWIEEQYKDTPLKAIASTFRVHENIIPYIKELKRQGDILLVELTEDVKPEGNIVTLNEDQYFDLLTAES